MAIDVFPGHSTTKSSGDVALSVTLDDTDRAQKVFDALAEKGEVQFPLEKQFCDDWHGNLTGRYGIR